MAHITLSIPDHLHSAMKRHPEIKWSEAARKGIREKLVELGEITDGKEIMYSLPQETQQLIKEASELDWKKWNKKQKEKGKKKAKSLMRVS